MLKINKDNIVKYVIFIIPSILAVIITIFIVMRDSKDKIYYSFYEMVLYFFSAWITIAAFVAIVGSFLAILEPFFRRNKRRSVSMIIAIVIVGVIWYLMNK